MQEFRGRRSIRDTGVGKGAHDRQGAQCREENHRLERWARACGAASPPSGGVVVMVMVVVATGVGEREGTLGELRGGRCCQC